jgi:hypothetical protein
VSNFHRCIDESLVSSRRHRGICSFFFLGGGAGGLGGGGWLFDFTIAGLGLAYLHRMYNVIRGKGF